jgi:hypothetical protein
MGVVALSRTGAVVTTKFEDRLPVFDSALPVYLSSASLIRHRNKLERSSVSSFWVLEVRLNETIAMLWV